MKEIYSGKKVLITGETGFKGSWLVEILKKLGAEVKGYSDNLPTNPSHYLILNKDIKGAFSFTDIRDRNYLEASIRSFKPDLIFHLAAQPLVLDSYIDPYKTYSTNFLGTLNLLEACRKVHQPSAFICITTDKVYKDFGDINYKENDQLGGFDPYSNSKACVELLVQSYRDSFFNVKDYYDKHNMLIATARAGNCIGGGDWSDNRIIPDIIRSIVNKEKLIIRKPEAIRPWQHVLEPLYGYLLLGEKLLQKLPNFSGAWNFGPSKMNEISVLELLKNVKNIWNDFDYEVERNNNHETYCLKLDSFKSLRDLNWFPKYNIEQTIEKTIYWYKEYYNNNNVITHQQINEYLEYV